MRAQRFVDTILLTSPGSHIRALKRVFLLARLSRPDPPRSEQHTAPEGDADRWRMEALGAPFRFRTPGELHTEMRSVLCVYFFIFIFFPFQISLPSSPCLFSGFRLFDWLAPRLFRALAKAERLQDDLRLIHSADRYGFFHSGALRYGDLESGLGLG